MHGACGTSVSYTHLDVYKRQTIRTVWGTPIEKLKQMFGNEMWEYCQKMAAPYLKNGKLEDCLLYTSRCV